MTLSTSSLALVVGTGLLLGSAIASAQGLRPVQAQTITSPRTGALAAPLGAASGQRAVDFIVAIVNTEPITNNEVRVEAQRLAQQLSLARRPVPGAAELGRVVLERMISEKAQLQLARETGIRIDDLAVDQAEQNVARQNQIDVPELRKRLAADGFGLAAYRESLRDQLALIRLREREVDSRVKVSDLEIAQFMREEAANPAANSATAAVQINLAQILVAVPEGATAQQLDTLQAKAQAALKRARAGEDFATLAKELSDAPDRANGGEMGVRNADRIAPLFLEATQNLAAGGISDVVRSGAGLHILKVLDKSAVGMSVRQSRARHILLLPSATLNEAQARERLLDYKRRIESGQADFAALARENSRDGSAQQGGDLGWASPGMFVPEFEQVMDALQPGQISEPLISRFGMHLIQLTERRMSVLSRLEQQDVLRNRLREKKLDEAFLVWAQEVRGRAYVELREPVQL